MKNKPFCMSDYEDSDYYVELTSRLWEALYLILKCFDLEMKKSDIVFVYKKYPGLIIQARQIGKKSFDYLSGYLLDEGLIEREEVVEWKTKWSKRWEVKKPLMKGGLRQVLGREFWLDCIRSIDDINSRNAAIDRAVDRIFKEFEIEKPNSNSDS